MEGVLWESDWVYSSATDPRFPERNGLGMKTKHGYNLGNIYYPSSQSHRLHFR